MASPQQYWNPWEQAGVKGLQGIMDTPQQYWNPSKQVGLKGKSFQWQRHDTTHRST